MDGARRKGAAIALRPRVGDEFDGTPRRAEHIGQGLGRKQMAARAAGSEENQAARALIAGRPDLA